MAIAFTCLVCSSGFNKSSGRIRRFLTRAAHFALNAIAAVLAPCARDARGRAAKGRGLVYVVPKVTDRTRDAIVAVSSLRALYAPVPIGAELVAAR